MAERPFERYLKDKEETEEIVPGERNSIDEIKESFQKGLTELSEPTKPVKFFKSFSLEKTEEGKIRDTSVLRFGIFLDPGLRIPMSVAAGEDIVKKLESEDEKDYISGELHPGDVKKALTLYINICLEPVRKHFESGDAKQLLNTVKKYRVTR